MKISPDVENTERSLEHRPPRIAFSLPSEAKRLSYSAFP